MNQKRDKQGVGVVDDKIIVGDDESDNENNKKK